MINYISYEYGAPKGTAQENQMFASSLNMGQSNPSYTSDQVDLELVGAEGVTSISTNVQWTPVVPGSFVFQCNGGAVIATDDGAGHITGEGITAGTIDYTNGQISITLASASTDEPNVSYAYNNENVPLMKVPEVNLKITSLPVVAKSRKMKAVYAFDAAYELEKESTLNVA